MLSSSFSLKFCVLPLLQLGCWVGCVCGQKHPSGARCLARSRRCGAEGGPCVAAQKARTAQLFKTCKYGAVLYRVEWSSKWYIYRFIHAYFWHNQNFYWYATFVFSLKKSFQNDHADPAWGQILAEFSADANQHISINSIEVKWFIGAAELIIIIIFMWRR